jgi:hypothetical protein
MIGELRFERRNERVRLGDEVAAQIVALRANDGSGDGLPYTPPIGLLQETAA